MHRYLCENGPFTPVAAALMTARIADSLAAGHADGVVHRDPRPANVLLQQLPPEPAAARPRSATPSPYEQPHTASPLGKRRRGAVDSRRQRSHPGAILTAELL
ncbi:hypothetical protein ACWGI9_15135 [Streptomyces sp. NPDC054833]